MQSLPSPLRIPVATIRTANGSFFKVARPFDSITGSNLFLNGEEAMESETCSIFKHLIEEASVFVDVGANMGFYTFVAKCYKPAVKVFAFEPEACAYSLLPESLEVNKWADVTAENMALSDSDGEKTLFVPKGESEASLNPNFRPDCVQQRCFVRKLDSYCREKGVNRIGLLKIDTESTEPHVLDGGREVIGDCRPDIICEVLKGRTEADLTRFLMPLGYRFYHLTREGPILRQAIEGDGTYRCLNYLFTTRDGF